MAHALLTQEAQPRMVPTLPKKKLTMWKHNISGAIFIAGIVTMLVCPAPGAELLKIGMVAPLSGPGADSGRYQIQGTELAIDEVNKAGGVLGRQIELVMEDDQTTNPGGLRAFRKLATQKDIPAFIGPIRSTEIHA